VAGFERLTTPTGGRTATSAGPANWSRLLDLGDAIVAGDGAQRVEEVDVVS
jgi:hypothetical protein